MRWAVNQRRIIRILWSLILMALAQPSVWGQARPATRPEGVVSRFGSVLTGQLVPYVFTWTNTTPRTVTIQHVEGTCGTLIGDYARQVKPGRTWKLPVSYNTRLVEGPVTKVFTVTTDDPKQATLEFRLEGTVLRQFLLSDEGFNFMELGPRETRTAKILVVNQLDRPAAIAGVKAASRRFSAAVRTIEPDKYYEVTVTAAGPFLPGMLEDTAVIERADAALPSVEIPIVARTLDETPPELVCRFGTVAAGTDIAHTFTLVNSSGRELTIQNLFHSADCELPRAVLDRWQGNRALRLAAGQTLPLPVTFHTARRSGWILEYLELPTNDPDPRRNPICFFFTGTVVQPVRTVGRAAFTFPRAEQDKPHQKTLLVAGGLTDRPLTITKASSNSRRFRPTLRPVEPGRLYELTVAATGPFLPGLTTGKIILETNCPQRPKLEIPAAANVTN